MMLMTAFKAILGREIIWLCSNKLPKRAQNNSLHRSRFSVGFPTQSQRQGYLFLSLFTYLSTDRSARHVVSILGVSTGF